jgi:hypothetical protein
MGYSGDQKPQDRKFDKNGNLIDPEDELLDSVLGGMFGRYQSVCCICKHINEDEVSCKAFPLVIPRDILMARVGHDKPYKGDNGIQFEPKE